ncbi:hypothetical protein Tco_0006171 [Tanacetum coccineum]
MVQNVRGETIPRQLAYPANVPASKDARVSPPIAKELPTNVAPTSFVITSGQNKEWGISYNLDDDVAEVTVVESKRVSSSPNNVVVSLFVSEKGDGSLPSSVVDEEAATNPSGV